MKIKDTLRAARRVLPTLLQVRNDIVSDIKGKQSIIDTYKMYVLAKNLELNQVIELIGAIEKLAAMESLPSMANTIVKPDERPASIKDNCPVHGLYTTAEGTGKCLDCEPTE